VNKKLIFLDFTGMTNKDETRQKSANSSPDDEIVELENPVFMRA
jgi:hypothetical protein